PRVPRWTPLAAGARDAKPRSAKKSIWRDMANYVFTSESVTEGHPDKMCDAISDAVLDAALRGDKQSRVACETAVKTGFVLLAGEITSRADIDYATIARQVVAD